MATQNKNILRFTDLEVGVPQTQKHLLNIDDVVNVVPDIIALNDDGFTVTSTDDFVTDVTVTRLAGDADKVDLWCWYYHSENRNFGPSNPQPNADGTPSGLGFQNPHPFIIRGGKGASFDTDELVKTNAADAAAGFLFDKIVNVKNIVKSVVDLGGGNLAVGLKAVSECFDEGIKGGDATGFNFIGLGVGAVFNPVTGNCDVTVTGGGGDGAVLTRKLFKDDTPSTDKEAFEDAMSGSSVTIPMDGDYCALFHGEGMNQSANAELETAIGVNTTLAASGSSAFRSQGNANDMRAFVSTADLPGLTAGDLIHGIYRRSAGSGTQSVALERRRLIVWKVQ